MQVFDNLLHIIEILRSPEGCPWDREQTLSSMRSALIEEVYEVVEAIDTENYENLKEEIGDLFFVTCFVGYLAQQQGLFTLEEVITHVTEKLIYRHPHVFSEKKEITVDTVLSRWESLKASEKSSQGHPLKSIPKSLPEIQRLYKILTKMKRLRFSWKLESLQDVTDQIARVVHHDPHIFFKGFLLYAFEQGLDLASVIRELSHELIEHYDRQKNTF